MSNEVRLAFSHPLERSVATVTEQDVDRISLRDHIVEVEIGAFQTERGTTQRVCFNVVVEVRQTQCVQADDVDQILSYDRVTEAIEIELAEERLNLLETLAERIADRILLKPQAIRAFVRIEKLDRGPGALGVEIVRSQRVVPQLVGEEILTDSPHPTLVFLSNAAIDSADLHGWIDKLQAAGRPVIICVGLPDTSVPLSALDLVQRRIDLLAIEQNAWRLAGKQSRCVVVATRTELDWGMKNDQISVWAPSKIVLDAVENPAPQPRETMALALWLGELLQADRMLAIGAKPPLSQSFTVVGIALEANLEDALV